MPQPTIPYNTLPYPTLPYSTPFYSTLLYSTLLYSTLLYSTLLYSTLLYSTLLYSTLFYSTLFYSLSLKMAGVQEYHAVISVANLQMKEVDEPDFIPSEAFKSTLSFEYSRKHTVPLVGQEIDCPTRYPTRNRS